jgi:hypothetical protein
MIKKANIITLMVAVAVLSAPLFDAGTAQAGVSFRFAYTSAPADIRVWLETTSGYRNDDDYDEYYDGHHDDDIYASVDDVVLYVRASRDCFATVYVVDTDGYIHIVHPLSPRHDAYLDGGRVYKIYLSEMGFDLDFGAGIAYAYAVSSPVPFDYDYYGPDVFGAGYGFRIYGDPYVAARSFYFNLVGGRCGVNLLAVSHTRFYVRQYVRYPRYLCAGWHDRYGVRTYCRGGCSVFRYYRTHVRDPHRVLHPTRRISTTVGRHTRIDRRNTRERDVRYKDSSTKSTRRFSDPVRGVKAKSPIRSYTTHSTKSKNLRPSSRSKTVVKSSRSSFVRSKKDMTELRHRLEKNAKPRKSGSSSVRKSATVKSSTKSGARVKSKSSGTSRPAKSSVGTSKTSKGAKSTKKRGK